MSWRGSFRALRKMGLPSSASAHAPTSPHSAVPWYVLAHRTRRLRLLMRHFIRTYRLVIPRINIPGGALTQTVGLLVPCRVQVCGAPHGTDAHRSGLRMQEFSGHARTKKAAEHAAADAAMRYIKDVTHNPTGQVSPGLLFEQSLAPQPNIAPAAPQQPFTAPSAPHFQVCCLICCFTKLHYHHQLTVHGSGQPCSDS